MPYHAGLDWGGTAHAVCVIDATGAVLARIEVRHDAAGLADLLARLKRIAPPAELPVAIGRPSSGLIVDARIEAGHPVVPIHPNIVKACRPRYRAAGGKSDPADTFMLADILRTDGHRFRLAELGDVRERFPTEDQLAAEAGVAPVTHASGKSRGVTFRWACNHRLRQASPP